MKEIAGMAMPFSDVEAKETVPLTVWTVPGVRLVGIVSVSYTHLDVYKRQVPPR